MARFFAEAMSQAPGLSGTPDSGHCSSAATSASCASSSATPTSRTIRARPAMSFADSIRKTAWIVRCTSEAVTAPDHSTSLRGCKGPLPLDVARVEHLQNLAFAVARDRHEPPGDLDRLLARLRLDEGKPVDELLRLGERTVGRREFAARELDLRSLRWPLQAAGHEEHAGSRHLLAELGNRGHVLRRRGGLARMGVR